MDYHALKKKYKADNDYPDRTFELQMYRKVLEGKMYDNLNYAFFQNFDMGNVRGSDNMPITLNQRRPSVRYRLCKIVVDDSVSLLFGEGRFPYINLDDASEESQDWMDKVVEKCKLEYHMIDAATKGSIGSVAVMMQLLNGRVFFEALYTEYLTPYFNRMNPDELLSVKEKCKKTGKELIELGYASPPLFKDETYWFMRVWDQMSETYYVPWNIKEDENYTPQVDKDRTIIHDLGFVPIVWIINLPGGANKIDGLCTFADGIDTNIELDYQLSQNGRGLKYSSEPLLAIKNPSLSMAGANIMAEGNVIEVDENGDVFHVEIDGAASHAVLEYCKVLREIVLENIHGNRDTPEKNHTVQSGVAMKLMNQALISLADKLRITYGEFGLKQIINMIIKANNMSDLIIGEDRLPRGTFGPKTTFNLQWPDWFPSTTDDRQKEATTLKTLTDGGILSKEGATESISNEYDIDASEERGKIEKEQAAQQELEQPKTTRTIAA